MDTEGAGGERGVVFRSGTRDCDTLEAAVENAGGRDQSYSMVRQGSLSLACRDSRGRRITVRATFEGCS